MKRRRIEVRYTEGESELIKKVANALDWNVSETLRRSLKFGLNALLKFESNKKMDLKSLTRTEDPTKQENNKPKEEKKEEPEQPTIEEQIETFCILEPNEPREIIENWIRSGTNKNLNDWKKENGIL